MNEYEFKAINLMTQTFEKHGVKFKVVEAPSAEIIVAGFSINGGPQVEECFISRDNGNDVAVRVFRLVTKTPRARRSRVLEACNILNRKVRHLKFSIDTDGNVNVEYDFPEYTPDNGIGEMALEIFARTMQTLNSEYHIFMKAIYTDEILEDDSLMKKLERLFRMYKEKKTAEDSETDCDLDYCPDQDLETADSSEITE